jgi:hypothetical protein
MSSQIVSHCLVNGIAHMFSDFVLSCLHCLFYLELLLFLITPFQRWGHVMAQLVEALRYKPESRGFDSR